jgi:type I restriction enzyme, S subunit
VLRELPEGWEWKNLGDVADIIMGQSPSGTSYNENREGTPFLQGNAEFGDNFPKHKKFTTEPSKIATKSSVLISVRAPVGDTNIADLNYCIGRGLASISLKNGDNKYLLYLLRSMKPIIEAKGTGSTFKAISKSIINEIEIPLPPLPVQRQIVAVLEQAEAVKRQRQEADALTGALLQSVFLEMFGNPVRNEKGWEEKELRKFGEVKTGNTPPRINPSNYGDFIEWIKSDNINSQSTYLERSQEYLSEEGLKIGRFAPKKSILITCIAGSLSCIGNAAIANRDVAFNQQINAIIPKSDVNELFLYHAILLSQEYIQNHATRSMTKMINKGVLSDLLFICPPFALQQQFARVVERVERIRDLQVASGKAIEGLCEGLMQRAFAGDLAV